MFYHPLSSYSNEFVPGWLCVEIELKPSFECSISTYNVPEFLFFLPTHYLFGCDLISYHAPALATASNHFVFPSTISISTLSNHTPISQYNLLH